MREAIGMVETRSLVAAIQAADTMVKTAQVTLMEAEYVGSGIVAVLVTGDVAAVTAAVENARLEVEHIAEIISINVIPRPHDEIGKILD